MACSKAFFDDNEEQAQIKLALTLAIPKGVHYHNLFIALSEMTAGIAGEWARGRNLKRWHKKSTPPAPTGKEKENDNE